MIKLNEAYKRSAQNWGYFDSNLTRFEEVKDDPTLRKDLGKYHPYFTDDHYMFADHPTLRIGLEDAVSASEHDLESITDNGIINRVVNKKTDANPGLVLEYTGFNLDYLKKPGKKYAGASESHSKINEIMDATERGNQAELISLLPNYIPEHWIRSVQHGVNANPSELNRIYKIITGTEFRTFAEHLSRKGLIKGYAKKVIKQIPDSRKQATDLASLHLARAA
jgi:hypothetical protein